MQPMSCLAAVLLAAGMLFGASAQAQDLPTDQLSRHADVARQGVLRDKTVFRNRPNVGRGRSYNQNKGTPAQAARAGATCANKGQAAALHGRADPRVRRLYALCA